MVQGNRVRFVRTDRALRRRCYARPEWRAELATVGREGIVGHMAARDFRALINRGSALEDAVHRYAIASHAFLAVSVACNSLHLATERCVRWLLIVQDRVGAGLIRYRRGHMEILDRPGLEEASCECHRLADELQRGSH